MTPPSAGPAITAVFRAAPAHAMHCGSSLRSTSAGSIDRMLGDWNACAAPMQNDPP